MNCKPGDLAMFVRSGAGNEGKVRRVLRLATSEELAEARFVQEPTWILDAPVPANYGPPVVLGKDRYLRPIRDPGNDAKDETLSWLPVPSTEKEAA